MSKKSEKIRQMTDEELDALEVEIEIDENEEEDEEEMTEGRCGPGKKKSASSTTPLFAKNDYVQSGDIVGQVELVSGERALVRVHNKAPTQEGWEPTLTKIMIPMNQLSVFADYKPVTIPKPPESTTGSRPFQVLSRTADSAEIVIYSDIGSSFWGEGMDAKMFHEQLTALGDLKFLDVRINSGGGDVFDGITIYNRLKQHKAKVRTYVDGLAASIASIIALAGDEITVYDTSTFMIHKPWSYAMGSSTELREVSDRLDMVEGQMLSIYKSRTGMSEDRLKSMLAAETWMTGEEAVDLGFADYLDSAPQALAASIRKDFGKKWFAHAPQNAPQPKEIVERRRRAQEQSAYLKARGFL